MASPSAFACNIPSERKCRRLGSMPSILSESLLPQQALSEETEQAALWPAPGTEAAAGMDSEARTFIPLRVASAPPKHRRESSNSSIDSDTRDFEEATVQFTARSTRHSPSGHTGSGRRLSSPAACSAARSASNASNSSNSSSEKLDSAHVVAPAMAFEARAPAIVSEGRAPAMASGLLPHALTRAPPKLERLSSNCSSILPNYRYREVDEPCSKSDLADQEVNESAEQLEKARHRKQEALHRQLAKNDKTDKGYDLTISASSMLGGFSIRDVLAPPTAKDFTWDGAAGLYRLLMATAVALCLYAGLTLILNRYLAARAYKDLSEKAYLHYYQNTGRHRRSAVYAFLSSLPIFLVAAALKQVNVGTLSESAGAVAILVVGFCLLVWTTIQLGAQLEDTQLKSLEDADEEAGDEMERSCSASVQPGGTAGGAAVGVAPGAAGSAATVLSYSPPLLVPTLESMRESIRSVAPPLLVPTLESIRSVDGLAEFGRDGEEDEDEIMRMERSSQTAPQSKNLHEDQMAR